MAKVIIDIGHGSNTYRDKHSKGVVVNGKVYEEHTFNAIVGVKVKTILESHGVNVKLTQQPNAIDVSLSERVAEAKAWGADILWSIHANAGDSSAEGVCAFYCGYASDPGGKRAAELYAKFAKESGLPLYHDGSWGSTQNAWNDFYMTRKTPMVAVLTENDFMTNPNGFKRIFQNDGDYHDKIALVNAKAILAYLGITYKGGVVASAHKEDDDLLEKAVVINAFPDFPFAEELAARLKAPIYTRAALPSGKIAKEVYVVGGTKDGLQADSFVMLTGKTRFDVAREVGKYLNK